MLKPNKLLTLGLAIGLGTGLLSACSGQPTEKEPAPNTQLLSSLTIRDAGLKNCIDTQAKEHNWTRVDQVVSLNCAFFAKSRMHAVDQLAAGMPLPDWMFPIFDASEIGVFNSLKSLNLSGNFFTKIDVRKLTRLENIALANAFIQELDLKSNQKLISINLAGTGLDKLDLFGLKNVKELDVSLNEDGEYSLYQDLILEAGSKIYGFDTNRFLKPSINLTLDPAASLTKVAASTATPIDILNNKDLEYIAGLASPRTFLNANKLKIFLGEISGSGVLDLSKTPALEAINISSKSFDEVIIHKNLKELSISSGVKKLTGSKDASLSTLNILGDGKTALSFGAGKIDVTEFSLQTLTLNNFLNGEMLDFSSSATIESLRVYGSKFGAIKLPIATKYVALTNTTASDLSPINQLLFFASDNCMFDTLSFESLASLHINRCKMPNIDFSLFPKLTNLTVSSSTIDTIDFTSAFDLDALNMQQSTINKMDFTPLGNKKRTRLYFLGNHLPSPESLRVQAIKIFSDFNWINNN